MLIRNVIILLFCILSVQSIIGCKKQPVVESNKETVPVLENNTLPVTSQAEENDTVVSEKPEEISYKFEEPWHANLVNEEQTKLLNKFSGIINVAIDENIGVDGFGCCYQDTDKEGALPPRIDRPFERKLVKKSSFTDENLIEFINLFPDTTGLALENSCVTDKGLQFLSTSKLKLYGLSFGTTDPDFADPMIITDRGMKYVGELHFLDTLCIFSCPITDIGAQYIGQLQSLQTLKIYNCPITDNAMENICTKNCKIDWLELMKTHITAKSFRSISTCVKIRIIFACYNNFSSPIDRETYESIVSLNGKVEVFVFTNSIAHPTFIRAVSEIKSLFGFAWDMTSSVPIWGHNTPHEEMSYEAILAALRKRHPDMDLTEWEKYREIEFGHNGEVIPKVVTQPELPMIRTWTTPNDKFSTKAKYISADENKVTLEKEDGTEITVDLSKLSQEDRDYVKRQLESETKTKKNEQEKP